MRFVAYKQPGHVHVLLHMLESCTFCPCRNVIEARCTDTAADALRKRVSQLTGKSSASSASHPCSSICCICGDVPDEGDGSFTLQACGCKVCTKCIKPMFTSAANSTVSFPMTCPGDSCGKAIIMRDMVSLADPDDLEKIMLQSYAQLKGKNADIFECQAMECQQIGRLAADEEVQHWHCDVCLATYCVPCQQTLKESVLQHKTMTCSKYQEAVQAVRDSANFDLGSMGHLICLCPGCQIPVEKSSGCLHMHCTHCDMHFCWGCGHPFGKGEQHTTYSHIWGCTGARAKD